MRTIWLTFIAMMAFAANSLLCRAALGEGLIDAASFTTIRAVSGAVTLLLIVLPNWRTKQTTPASWRSALMLFIYMAFFSFAYLSLSAGTGALLLFGAVQLTMFTAALRGGEPFSILSWCGLVLAVVGIIYLVLPGVTAPDPLGAALMVIAGIAWGLYSLTGKGVGNPLQATANNFLLAVPLAILVSVFFIGQLQISVRGLLLALVSGSVTSGLGYAIWFAALKGLKATRAATVQLSVPAIAAAGGVLVLAEPITLRLVLASAATLGGIAIVLKQKG
jgi:drug/metabolite transporter (DMT)-like permease